MKISRNDPCPCGSGKKHKKCCLNAAPQISSPKYRFEPGSYHAPGRGYMPSAICYANAGGGQWKEHFCVVNPKNCFEEEVRATQLAAADLGEAAAIQQRTGSDGELALLLKAKGYGAGL